MSVFHYLFIAICARALSQILWRYLALRDVGTWSSLIVCTAGALPFLLCFVPLPSFTSLPLSAYVLLSLNAVVWVAAGWFDMKACRYLSPTVDSLYGSLTLIFATIAGVIIFGETISLLATLGMLLIFGAVLFHEGMGKFTFHTGVMLKLGSVVSLSLATIIDKQLVHIVSPEVVTYGGFILPACLYVILGHGEWRRIVPDLRLSKGMVLFTPICSVISYYALMKAFAAGKLSVASPLLEMTIVLVFIFDIALLGAREGLWRKGLACFTCLCGASLICIT